MKFYNLNSKKKNANASNSHGESPNFSSITAWYVHAYVNMEKGYKAARWETAIYGTIRNWTIKFKREKTTPESSRLWGTEFTTKTHL